MSRFFIAVVLCTGSSATSSASSVSHPSAGHLVLVGGALDENRRILRTFVRLADPDGDGPQRARIAIVTAGSIPAETAEEAADPEQDNAAANGIYYSDLFQRFGAETYAVPIDEGVDYPGDPYVPANADDARVAQSVHESTGVWFGGGDQMRYVRTLLHCAPAEHEAFHDCSDSMVLRSVRAVLADGGAIGGTSAGLTIQQGAAMVTGGQPYEGWRGGARPGYFEGRRLAYVPYGGFGFFSAGMLDSHFATWSRQPRMIRLALDNRVQVDRIVGVDETTALVVDQRTQRARVIGRNGASFLDVSDADLTDGGGPGAGVRGVQWAYLTQGDRIDLSSGDVQRADGSTELVGDGPPPPRKEDVWDTIEDDHVYSLRDLAVELVRSAARTGMGVTYDDYPQYTTTVVKGGRSSAWTTPKGRVSFEGLELQIAPTAPDPQVGRRR